MYVHKRAKIQMLLINIKRINEHTYNSTQVIFKTKWCTLKTNTVSETNGTRKIFLNLQTDFNEHKHSTLWNKIKKDKQHLQ